MKINQKSTSGGHGQRACGCIINTFTGSLLNGKYLICRILICRCRPRGRVRRFPRVSILNIRKPGQIIHTCIKSQSDPAALLEGIIAFAVFDFGIITLINTCEMLHLYLCVAPLAAQFFQT